MTDRQKRAALDYLERRRAGESSRSWSRATASRHRAVLRALAVDYSDVPLRSADAPTRELESDLAAFSRFLERSDGSALDVIPTTGADGRPLFVMRETPADGERLAA